MLFIRNKGQQSRPLGPITHKICLKRALKRYLNDRSLRQVKYNLVVYDLEQVSREIDEIMFMMSQEKEYEGLTEPAVSQYDDVLASTMAGIRKAAEVCLLFARRNTCFV